MARLVDYLIPKGVTPDPRLKSNELPSLLLNRFLVFPVVCKLIIHQPPPTAWQFA